MKVKATKVGFYGELRKVGEVFTVADRKHLGSWMKEIKTKVKTTETAK